MEYDEHLPHPTLCLLAAILMWAVLLASVGILFKMALEKELDNADRTYYDKEYKQMMYTEERV